MSRHIFGHLLSCDFDLNYKRISPIILDLSVFVYNSDLIIDFMQGPVASISSILVSRT